MRENNNKFTPYGYIKVNGETIGRCDTVKAALKEAKRIIKSFAFANTYPLVTVQPWSPYDKKVRSTIFLDNLNILS